METNKKVLDKIKKLLTLAEDKAASEGEVENALKAAEALMMRHQIDRDDVFMSKNDIMEDELFAPIPSYESSEWVRWLAVCIGKGYNCRIIGTQKWDMKTLKSKRAYKVVGFDEDVVVVKETALRMVPVVQNLAKQRTKASIKSGEITKGRATNFHNSYIHGFIEGLEQKLQEQRDSILTIESEIEKWEMVVVKKNELVKEWISENIEITLGKARRGPADINYSAFSQGIQDGKQSDKLNKQIG